MNRLLASILLLAAAPGLSGCAAAVVPVATGLLLGTRTVTADDNERRRTPAPSTASAEAGSGTSLPETEAPAAAQQVLESISEERLAAEIAGSAGTLTELSQLPPPGNSAAAQTGPGTDAGSFQQLFAAATAIAQRDPFSEEKRLSAILEDPTALSPERAECAFAQTAVLVDLDPGEKAAPLGEDAVAPTQLTRVLATLRAQEVAVLWLSRHTADRAGVVRRTLRESGLDPQGQDDIYLVRYQGETKASRRADAARDYCVVAILGDEKRDFDELFAFLKNPDEAIPLEAIIGEAWFLAPPPLTQPQIPAPQDPTPQTSSQG